MISSMPSQYLKGWVEFYKLKFKVTSAVLIPRPETELLVDEVLKFVKNYTLLPKPYPLIILDLGTGSGNIAISIAKNLSAHPKGINIIATDISKKALLVAKQNARLHGIRNRVQFVKSNLLSIFCHSGDERSEDSKIKILDAVAFGDLTRMTPDIIVTNLPYIPSARIPYLDSSVRDFEPKIALDGGQDGFGLYRRLFQQIKKIGWRPKLIIGEIDYTHGELAANEAQKHFPDSKVEVKKDLTHLQRVLTVKS